MEIYQTPGLMYIPRSEAEWDISHIPLMVVGQVFYSIKRQFQREEEAKELSHGIWEFIPWLSGNQLNMTNSLEVK